MDDELESDVNYDVNYLDDISENEYDEDENLFGEASAPNAESLRNKPEKRNLDNTEDNDDTSNYYDVDEMPPPPTTDIYPDVESAERAMNDFSVKYGYSIVKLRSVSRHGKRFRIQYECSRGRIRSTVTSETRRRSKVSNRLNCPFRMNLRLERQNGEWKNSWVLSVRNPHHNHPPSIESNPLTLRKTYLQKHRAFVIKLLRQGTSISEVLKQLEELDPSVTLQKWDISNLRRELEHQSTKKLLPFEVLTMRFPKTGDGFINFVTGSNTKHGVFMLHRTGLELLTSYYQILFIDRTFKENKFKTPVLMISSALPNNKTFFLGLAFLNSDIEQAYKYMLVNLRHTYRELKLPDPLTVFTERDPFLMKALRQVFPGANNILSQIHSKSNFIGSAKIILSMHLTTRNPSLLEEPEKFQLQAKAHEDSLMVRWNRIITAPTMEAFNKAKDAFVKHYRGTTKLIEYIETTWLCPHVIRSLAPCFTDSYFHMGFRSMVRIASINERLKDLLYNESLDLLSACKEFDITVAAHNKEMHREIFSEEVKTANMLSPGFYAGLPSNVNFYASNQIEELRNIYLPAGSPGKQIIAECTGKTYRSRGIPCIHQILTTAEDIARQLKAEDFHPFWHTISESSRQDAVKLVDHLAVLDHVKFRSRVRRLPGSVDNSEETNNDINLRNLDSNDSAQSSSIIPQSPQSLGQSQAQCQLQHQQHQQQPITSVHDKDFSNYRQQNSNQQHHLLILPQPSSVTRIGRQAVFDIQTPESIMRATNSNSSLISDGITTVSNSGANITISNMGMLNPMNQQQQSNQMLSQQSQAQIKQHVPNDQGRNLN